MGSYAFNGQDSREQTGRLETGIASTVVLHVDEDIGAYSAYFILTGSFFLH